MPQNFHLAICVHCGQPLVSLKNNDGGSAIQSSITIFNYENQSYCMPHSGTCPVLGNPNGAVSSWIESKE